MADKLALDGGDRIVAEGEVKTWPPHDQRDRDAIMRVFDSNVFHGNSAPHAVEMQEKHYRTYAITKLQERGDL